LYFVQRSCQCLCAFFVRFFAGVGMARAVANRFGSSAIWKSLVLLRAADTQLAAADDAHLPFA
jgi:hypothetical protein